MINGDSHCIPIALSLGANLGDRLHALRYAIKSMSAIIQDIIVSNVYETEPVGFKEQPSFLNCACIGYTNSTLEEIMVLINAVHQALHRKPRPKWHEREIDIDILLFGDSVIESEHIMIPHPRLHERAFVLRPLSDIAPEMIHPLKQKTIQALMATCEDDSAVVFHCDSTVF
ncbi:MAG: 2-amino-4-hydroxy-6-hydroxymethyldihydropteridine pyrophosphokinae [Bacteroidota bacterium]